MMNGFFQHDKVCNKTAMNHHWMDLYKSYVFCANRKFKMVTMRGHSFNIGPYGKMLKKYS